MEAVKNDEKLQSNQEKKHPPGLYLLFFTEMWERFSYYGMRALLILYLTTQLIGGGLGFSESSAAQLYGTFTGLVYFTPLIGGWLADRFLGQRKAITIGGITMALGQFTLFAGQNKTFLYLGLFLLIIGNGFFKPNISTLVGRLYPQGDARRDSAFTIFYMGINVGAFFSPLICGTLAEQTFATFDASGQIMSYGFKYGFLAAAIGMVVGQLIFNVFGNKYLGDIGKYPAGHSATGKDTKSSVDTNKPLTKKEKQRTAVIFILTAFVVFFWAGFEQAGSSMTLYTEKFVNRNIGGWEMPVTWFQSLNPVFIVILAPIIAKLWVRLAKRDQGDISIPTKMAYGMILLGLGFLLMVGACIQRGNAGADATVQANIMWLVGAYFFHTLGELFLSPVGLSMVSSLAPVKLASLLMGVWLLSSAIANYLSGIIASFVSTLGALQIFAAIAGVSILVGLVLLSLNKKLVAMMND